MGDIHALWNRLYLVNNIYAKPTASRSFFNDYKEFLIKSTQEQLVSQAMSTNLISIFNKTLMQMRTIINNSL